MARTALQMEVVRDGNVVRAIFDRIPGGMVRKNLKASSGGVGLRFKRQDARGNSIWEGEFEDAEQAHTETLAVKIENDAYWAEQVRQGKAEWANGANGSNGKPEPKPKRTKERNGNGNPGSQVAQANAVAGVFEERIEKAVRKVLTEEIGPAIRDLTEAVQAIRQLLG